MMRALCMALVFFATGAEAREADDALRARQLGLISWISRHSDYEMAKPPPVLFLSSEKINKIYYDNTESGYQGQDNIEALYFPWLMVLPDSFELLKDDHVLVHELVHHLQEVHQREFPCPALKEQEAYLLQAEFFFETGIGTPPDAFLFLFLVCSEWGS